MAEIGPTTLGTDKSLKLRQEVAVAGEGEGKSTLGPTILGIDKLLKLKQEVVGGGGKNQ